MLIAQLFLPPEDKCSCEYLRDLLSGKKKAFHRKQVKTVMVKDRKYMTLKGLTE